jgi:flagellar biosynthesis chaperone FliJ
LRAYQQAQAQLKMLTELIQTAQSTVGFAEQAAQGSQQELNEKTQLLEAAKNRVEKLLRELKAARVDYGNTKKQTYKASMAAKEARQNV